MDYGRSSVVRGLWSTGEIDRVMTATYEQPVPPGPIDPEPVPDPAPDPAPTPDPAEPALPG